MNELLQVKDLKKYYPVTKGLLKKEVASVKAVDGVSFTIREGETFGLVGESGCGKTTVGKMVVRLLDPTAGEILFRGQDIVTLKKAELLQLRKEIQIIFQDPYGSLNPRMTIHDIIAEPIKKHHLAEGEEITRQVIDLLNRVGLSERELRKYPHEFSGGQRQRIGIARALALDPEFIVCDEPISALDVSIQAQIVNLLERIQAERGISYLFIAHDLTMVRHISRQIGVMYMGYLVELGDADEVCERPLHPYTQILMSAVPKPDPITARLQKYNLAVGEVPSPIDLPAGCPFAPRCQYAGWECRSQKPPLREIDGRQVACFYAD